MRLFAIFALAVLTASGAAAQLAPGSLAPGNSSPGFAHGQIPSAELWNSVFQTKFDFGGGLLGGPLGLLPRRLLALPSTLTRVLRRHLR
jgi:hypothetical protein